MIENPDFALVGAAPGIAERWTLRTHVAHEAIAAFDASRFGEEPFERWTTLEESFDVIASDRRFFGLAGSDDFDWNRYAFVDALEPTMVLPALFGSVTSDAFAWRELVDDWSAVIVTGAATEDLEHDWRNDSFATELDAAHAVSAIFDFGSVAETFDGTWPGLTRS